MSIASASRQRVYSIDLLRGFVMIIMALDHVRDYFHKAAFIFDPLDLERTSVILFFTRWITHYCAPVFVFLAGVSACLVGMRKSKKELSLFLLKRGVWLVFIEMVVVNFGWHFSITFPWLLFIVIWALGVSMIVLAGLIHLPKKLIFAIGIILVAGHNLLDGIHIEGNNFKAFIWSILHNFGIFNFKGENFFVAYPIIPWVGIMALGYCFGSFYDTGYGAAKRKKNLLLIGCLLIAAFIILRFSNLYGNPTPWTSQKNIVFTILDFIKVNKYPPSLLYAMMTLGPAIIFLALTENATNKLSGIISVYGRVPMFYYILHIYLIHLLAIICSVLFTNLNWRVWLLDKPLWINESFVGYGYSLKAVYLVWVIVVIGLYPLCKKYDAYKMANKNKWWLSYL